MDEQFTYLPVAEDTQFFTILNEELLSKCTTDFYNLCPSSTVLRKIAAENCLIAPFLRKTEVAFKTCKRVFSDDLEPVWIRSPGAKHCVYSLTNPIRLTLRCRPGGSPLADEIYETTLSVTVSLHNTSTCYTLWPVLLQE